MNTSDTVSGMTSDLTADTMTGAAARDDEQSTVDGPTGAGDLVAESGRSAQQEAARRARTEQLAARRAQRQAERAAATRRVEDDVVAASRADPADAYTAEVAADILDHRADAARRQQSAARDAVTAARAALAAAEQAGTGTATARGEFAAAGAAAAAAGEVADRAVAEMDAQNTVWRATRTQPPAQDRARGDEDACAAYERWGFATAEQAHAHDTATADRDDADGDADGWS